MESWILFGYALSQRARLTIGTDTCCNSSGVAPPDESLPQPVIQHRFPSVGSLTWWGRQAWFTYLEKILRSSKYKFKWMIENHDGDKTSCKRAQHGWELLCRFLTYLKVWPVSNFAQQIPTTHNERHATGRARRTQHVTSNNVGSYVSKQWCVRLHGAQDPTTRVVSWFLSDGCNHQTNHWTVPSP